MSWDIQIIAYNTGSIVAPNKQVWVKRFVPASMDARGRYLADGDLLLTDARREAIKFETNVAAFEFYQQSKGLRPDGKPNRPLCSYTVEISNDETE